MRRSRSAKRGSEHSMSRSSWNEDHTQRVYPQIAVVQNWFEELKRRLPPGKEQEPSSAVFGKVRPAGWGIASVQRGHAIMARAGSVQRASARKNSPGLFGGGVALTRRDGQ
jgi:hypothetical protein